MQRKVGKVAIAAVLLLSAVWAFAAAIANSKSEISNVTAAAVQEQAPGAPVVVAQLSDLHLGLRQNPMSHAPLDPLDNLRRAIEMVNRRHPDVIIVSGDIGENPQAWQEARDALKQANAPVYWVPGNHDVHSRDVERYRRVFGRDYYKFRVRNVEFYVLDSQLLGNYDHFDAREPEPLPPETAAESEKMLKWLQEQADEAKQHPEPGVVRVAVQHIPTSRGVDKVPDQKPYWITQEPYRSKEIYLLQQLGVKDMLVGHWHKPVVFEEHGFTHHVAPAVSWAVKPPIGFAMQTITPDGRVKTEFVTLQ